MSEYRDAWPAGAQWADMMREVFGPSARVVGLKIPGLAPMGRVLPWDGVRPSIDTRPAALLAMKRKRTGRR